MILGETQLSRRATEETLPFRDAFAVLFFVSAGMLFDPAVVTEQPGALIATLATIMVGKSVAAYAIVRALGHSNQTAFTICASLAQIGEFSFILAELGTNLAILPPQGRDLILAGAIISIVLNPLLFSFAAKRHRLIEPRRLETKGYEASSESPSDLPDGHIVLVGYGRVGKLIATALAAQGHALVVIEDQRDTARSAEAEGLRVILGNGAEPSVLQRAGIEKASKLLIAIPEGYEGGTIAKHARALNPELPIIARAHSDQEVQHLEKLGANQVVMAEREAAARMAMLATTRPAEDRGGLLELADEG